MLLSEMVRKVSKDAPLIADDTQYEGHYYNSWGTLHDYGNITLSEASLVVISFDVWGANEYYYAQAARLKLGGTLVWGRRMETDGVRNEIFYIWLSAGTYQALVECWNSWGGLTRISGFRLGKAMFSDEQGYALATYSSTVTVTINTRKTPLGDLKRFMIHVRSADTVGGVSLTIDGAGVGWTEQYNNEYGEGVAYGRYSGWLNVGSHTISLSGGSAGKKITVYASPWTLASSDSQAPIDLAFPQGSTAYLILEPLARNWTKTAKLGMVRAVSFGDSTNYYSTVSGTGILTWSYTYEAVDVAEPILVLSGYSGCISVISVDLR